VFLEYLPEIVFYYRTEQTSTISQSNFDFLPIIQYNPQIDICMKKLKLLFITSFFLLSLFVLPSKAYSWFGAGKTPGWPATTTGLTGEIALPQYKFAPDFYTVGGTVSINIQAVNLNNFNVTSHYYLAISKVKEAPIGTDISDGTPTTPGLNENQLNDYHQANNDIQSLTTVIDLGNFTFPANGNLTFGRNYTTTNTGYFQFDFMDIDPRVEYQPGHILGAGFFRVLAKSENTNPTPTPNPGNTTTTDICKNLDGIQTSVPDTYHLAGENCLQWELGGAPTPGPLGASTGTGGQVLGASTTRLANTSSNLILPRVLSAILVALGIFFIIIVI